MAPVDVAGDTSHPTTSGDAAPSPAARPSRSRRLVVAAVAVGSALVMAGGLVGWHVWSTNGVDGVTVGWAGEPRCTGTSLRPGGHAIEWTRDMSCVVTVRVHNPGPATVHVTGAVLPFLGPGAAGMVQASDAGGPDFGPTQRFDVDATLVLDHSIEPGGSWTFPVRMVYRPDGCDAAGTSRYYGWPAVDVSARGRDRQVPSNRTLVIHSSHQNPGCVGAQA